MRVGVEKWSVSTLGDTCDLYQPKTISRKEMVEDGRYLVYGANGVIGRYSAFNHEESEVLLSCRGNCGTVNVSKPLSWINGNAMVCRPKVLSLTTEYLRYFLESIDYSTVITGTAQRQITREPLAKVQISFPDVEIQSRIIETLEDHLSRLDAAMAGLITTRSKASNLFSAIASQALRPGVGWRDTTLGEISSSVRNGVFVSRASELPNGVPILRIGAVRPLELDLSDLRYTRRPYEQFAKDTELLEPGDLLFTRYNGNSEYVAACAEVPHLDGPLTYPDKLIRVRLQREVAHPAFVALACTTGSTREFLRSKVKTTAGQAGISGTDLKAAPIALPPLEIQAERLLTFERMREHLDAGTGSAGIAELKAPNLRRSLLHAAFTGQLTKEPASV
jgi:type I restriction enzyme S subunit